MHDCQCHPIRCLLVMRGGMGSWQGSALVNGLYLMLVVAVPGDSAAVALTSMGAAQVWLALYYMLSEPGCRSR